MSNVRYTSETNLTERHIRTLIFMTAVFFSSGCVTDSRNVLINHYRYWANEATRAQDYQLAQQLYERVLADPHITEKENESDRIWAMSGLANAYGHLRNYEKSDELFHASLRAAEDHFGTKGENSIFVFRILVDMSRLYRERGLYAEAVKYYEVAVQLAKNNRSLSNYSSRRTISEINDVFQEYEDSLKRMHREK